VEHAHVKVTHEWENVFCPNGEVVFRREMAECYGITNAYVVKGVGTRCIYAVYAVGIISGARYEYYRNYNSYCKRKYPSPPRKRSYRYLEIAFLVLLEAAES